MNSAAPSSLASSKIAYAERKAAQLEKLLLFFQSSGLELVIDTDDTSIKIGLPKNPSSSKQALPPSFLP